MATSSLLLSPLSASSAIENRDSSFVHNAKRIYAAPRRNLAVRRWCFRSPVASNSFNHIPKQFRQENLKDGLMENFKNVPQSLYGLNPKQMNMFMSSDNPVSLQSESVTEESISSAYNYKNYCGLNTGMKKRGPSFSSMSVSMYSGREYGRPRTAAPDLPSLLLDSRIVYLGMPIVPAVSELLIAQFMYLDYDSDTKPIYLYINSTGIYNEQREMLGSETDAFIIADLMRYVKAKVYTVNLAVAYGQAAMLLALGEKGYRALLPSANTKLYLPSIYRSSGSSTDMWIKAKELDANTEIFLDLLAQGIGKPKEEIAKDISHSKYMSPQQAIEYGVADKIMVTLDTYEKNDDKEIAARSNGKALGQQEASFGKRRSRSVL